MKMTVNRDGVTLDLSDYLSEKDKTVSKLDTEPSDPKLQKTMKGKLPAQGDLSKKAVKKKGLDEFLAEKLGKVKEK